jgi:hypothetical protein
MMVQKGRTQSPSQAYYVTMHVIEWAYLSEHQIVVETLECFLIEKFRGTLAFEEDKK